MKRFWREARVEAGSDGHLVLLDGKPVRTPAKRPLALPTEALARAVAMEWQAQGEVVKPAAMPLTQLCCTTLDLTLASEAAVAREVAAYGATDLLCYRAAEPPSLAERQRRLWQPLLDWAARCYAAPLTVTSGLVAVVQPPASLAALDAAVAAFRGFRLTALADLVRGTGSLVLGLAVAEGEITAELAFDAAELDATHQMELWGTEHEAVQRRAALKADLASAARLLELTRAN